jgi:hypothetical protein
MAPPGPGGGRTDGMASASLVLGISSIPMHFCCYLGWPLGIAAVVLGIVALGRIRDDRNQASGRSLAWTGIATAVLGFMLIIAIFVIYGAAAIFAAMQGSP